MTRYVKITREHLLLPEGAIVRVVGEKTRDGRDLLIVRQGNSAPYYVEAEHTTEVESNAR